MKKLFILFIIAGLLSTGCGSDDLENLTTITSHVTLTQTYEVRAEGEPLIYSASQTFDATQDDEYARFGDRIDDISITSVTYTILNNTNYQNADDATIVDAAFSFKDSDGASIDVASISNQNIAVLLGQESPMSFDQDALNAMAAEFETNNKISADASVELDNPVSFDMEIAIELEVSGSVID